MSEFNINKAAEELQKRAQPRKGGRKLTFADQCAAFAALRQFAEFNGVAKVFNLSRTSVSYLAGCLTDDRAAFENTDGGIYDPNLTRNRMPDRQPRYRAVAVEFNRLGEQEFIRRYYTQRLHNLLLDAQPKPKLPQNRLPPNLQANTYAGVHDFGESLWIIIEYLPDAGWAWCECEKDGDIGTNKWKGSEEDPSQPFEPFKTSNAALAHAKTIYETAY